ncbi:unnamed protein product [Clonostachys solani]|uniref:BZIP domain-containing protein n=1 Tax=Clonostachys solani TaxID=160281 RepID=A0A9N9W478_9HYPO|nr:unnamed protein product [Clonostachys solani]
MDRPTTANSSITINVARRISNLTSEQAEKKRAIDRDNQRYHRAKNKSYIKALEQKVFELTAQVHELEGRVHQYQQAEEERQQKLASAPPLTPRTPSTGASLEIDHHDHILFSAALHQQLTDHDCVPALPLDFGTGITIHALNSGQGIDLLDFDITNSIDSVQSTVQTPEHLAVSSANSQSFNWTSTSSGNIDLPTWQRLPLHIEPSSKIEEVIKTITESWSARISRLGNRQEEFRQPVFPSIGSLLNRPEEDERDMARSFFDAIAAQVWRSTVKTLAERIGFMYTLSHLIRWLVCRSKETYELLPPFLRPTELQLTVPHPAWVDTIVWPAARDAIITEMDWGRFEEFRRLGGNRITVRWPYPDSTAIIESPDKKTMLLHPSFEAHIRNSDNWRVGPEVGDAFPFMKPFCAG